MWCFRTCVHESFASYAVWGSSCTAFLFFTRPFGDGSPVLGAQAPGAAAVEIFDRKFGKEVLDTARYKVSCTVYKDPAGKTLKGPTFVHLLGDICSAFGLIGVLGAILAVMEKYGTAPLIGAIVMAVVGFVLMAVLHRQAKKSAEIKFLQALARQEGQTVEHRD